MNIYISNLSYAVNDGDLKDLFGEYGEISSAKVITDRETGRSRGFGFVEMADDRDTPHVSFYTQTHRGSYMHLLCGFESIQGIGAYAESLRD